MPGKPRRRDNASNATTVGSILSVIVCVAVGIGIVYLKAQRRAERRAALSGQSDDSGGRSDGGGGYSTPDRPSFTPTPPASNPVPPSRPEHPQPGTLAPQNPPVTVQPGSAATPNPPARPVPSTLPPGVRQTMPQGGAFASIDYSEYRDDGGMLIGFEVGYGKVFDTTIIAYLRPIWLTPRGEEYGTAYGRSQTQTVIVKARDGYAVGGIVLAGGGALEGFCLTFMRRGQHGLNPNDWYTSDWYGEPTRRPAPEQMRSGDGAFVIGIFGKRFADKGGPNFDDGGAIATIGFVTWARP